jgi:hypothetical protein
LLSDDRKAAWEICALLLYCLGQKLHLFLRCETCESQQDNTNRDRFLPEGGIAKTRIFSYQWRVFTNTDR